jgi:uncharacterized membrane protein YedE/YeeE
MPKLDKDAEMHSDWLWGAIGGLMIGTAGGMFLLINGRIMGASGILGEVVDRTAGTTAPEKLGFLGALIAVPALLAAVFGGQTHTTSNVAVLLIGGLLVGFGTRIANGCTSGHGVCGMSRLSLRGIAASATYVLAGGAVMAVLRHVWGLI